MERKQFAVTHADKLIDKAIRKTANKQDSQRRTALTHTVYNAVTERGPPGRSKEMKDIKPSQIDAVVFFRQLLHRLASP